MDNQLVEEITKVIDNVQTYGTKCYPDKYEPFDSRIENDDIAYELISAGYRKIQDNELVITKDEYESLKKGVHTVSYQAMITESDQQHWLNGYKVGYRDGVVAVGVQTKQALEKIKTELIGEEQKQKTCRQPDSK